MSFSFDASKQQTSAPVAGNVQNTALPTFSFGPPTAGDAGKTLTPGFPLMPSPAQNKPGSLFATGLTNTPPQNTGLNFGTPNTSAPGLGIAPPPQTSGLSFGTAAPANPGISFGAGTVPSMGFPAAAPTASTQGFSLGGSTTATTAATGGLNFGVAKPTTTTGFSLGGGDTVQAPTGSGLTFGTPNAMAPGSGYNLGSTPTATTASATTSTATSFNLGSNITSTTTAIDSAKTSTVQTGFSVASTAAPLQSDSSFGTSTANTTASTGFSLAGSGTTSAATGFSFGTGTTAASTTGFPLNKTATAPISLAAPSTQISLGTTTTVTSSANGSQPAPINFFQLEESINKWTLELEEQEKVFVNQATQVNAWDKLLIFNGEKIVTLNQEVERVKIEQQQLEHELDYVVGQQKELQDCLVPLEKELASHSVSDPEREHTYGLAKDLDTQLKRMSEDLKEIIEHLNQANRSQDSSDPIVQIGKILNAHMNSLQWLDQQTAMLSQKIQQIDQMHQNFRQENERSFNLAYN